MGCGAILDNAFLLGDVDEATMDELHEELLTHCRNLVPKIGLSIGQ